MEELKKKIIEAGLQITKVCEWRETGGFYYEAEYRYKTNGNVIAQYFFVPCTADIFRTNILHDESLVEMIERPAFFKLQNDVSWNLYLVCVMEGEEYEKLEFHEKQLFLDNENYSRKILVTEEEFHRYIPNGKIVQRGYKRNVYNPIEIWEEQLAKHALEFCLQPYSGKAVTAFLEGNAVVRESKNNLYDLNKGRVEKIDRIQKLKLTQAFRPNCYGKSCELGFTGVNLLDGNNGAGKTSILEAIELIITGEIRKTSSLNESLEKDSKIYFVYNDDKKMRIPVDKKQEEKKRRERSWYRQRTDRKPIELNDAFHVYNLYSAEQTFIATYQNKGNNIDEYLSGALFGLEVRNAEENIKSYKGEFGRKHRELTNALENVNAQIEKYSDQISISEAVMLDYLNKSYLAFYENNKMKELPGMLNAVIIAMQEIEGIRDIPSSGYQLKEAFREVEEELDYMNHEICNGKMRNQGLRESLQKMRLTLDRCQFHLEDFEEKKKKMQQLVWNKKYLQIFLQSPREISEWRTAANVIEEKENEIISQVVFYETYKLILQVDSWSDLEDTLKKYNRLENTYRKLQDESEGLKKKIEQRRRRWDGLQNTILMIKDYGKRYIHEVDVVDECPLCGNKDTSLNQIMSYLEKEISVRDSELEELEDRYREKEEYLQKVQVKMQDKSACRNVETLFLRAKESLELGGDNEAAFEYICRKLRTYEKKEAELHEAYKVKESFESILDRKFSESEYKLLQHHWDELLKDTKEKLDIENCENVEEDSDEIMEAKFLFQMICAMEKDILQEDDYRKQYEDLKKWYEETEEEYNSENKRYEKCLEKQTSLDRRKRELEYVENFYVKIWRYVKSNTAKLDFYIFQRQIREIQNLQIQYAHEEENQIRKKQLLDERASLKQQIERCSQALKVLHKIKFSSDYAKEFIRENIEHISEIFLGLHAPREFDALQFDVNNNLVALRNSEEIPIYRLSTGQKTAVVLAIFFKMNLLLTTTPGIILLDEPVANIDDLNTISLLDFVREIYLSTGKQIFFTTANYSIQKLFRRKFSFLGEEFQELSFSRGKELKTRIQKNVYDQERLKERTEILS